MGADGLSEERVFAIAEPAGKAYNPATIAARDRRKLWQTG
jgi:hypothetical protein